MWDFLRKKDNRGREFTQEERSKGGAMTAMRKQQKEDMEFMAMIRQQRIMDVEYKRLLSGSGEESSTGSSDPFMSAMQKEIDRDAMVKKYIKAKYGIDPDDIEGEDLEDDDMGMGELVKEWLKSYVSKKNDDAKPSPDVARVGKKLAGQTKAEPKKKAFGDQEEKAIEEIVSMFFKGADKKTQLALKTGKKMHMLDEQTFIDVAAEAGRRIYNKL